MASQHDSQPLIFEGFWQHGDLKIGQFRKWLDLCIIVAESDWGLYPIAIDNTDPSDNDIISDIDILGQDPEQVLPTGHYVILKRESELPLHISGCMGSFELSRTLNLNLPFQSAQTRRSNSDSH